MSESIPPPRPELLRGTAQFDAVLDTLTPILSRYKYYYGEEHRGIQGVAIIQALQGAQQAFEQGNLQQQKAIRLFVGQQSLHTSHPEESANWRVVETLYNALHQIVLSEDLTWRPRRIETDSITYASLNKDLLFNPESTLPFPVTTYGTAALHDKNGKLSGVQLQLGENIYANFWVENLQSFAEVRRTAVDLILEPNAESTPRP